MIRFFIVMGVAVITAGLVAGGSRQEHGPGSQAASAPATTVSPGSSPPADTRHAFPDGSTTGVQPGVALRPSRGLEVDTPGTVIEGLDVRGAIEIIADDVTIRNTRVLTGEHRYPIRVHPGVTGVLLEHVEVSNENQNGKAIYFRASSGTVRYANVHSAEDGIFITGDEVTIEYSYVHSLARTGTSHNDAIQIRRGNGITIRGNNLQAFNPATNDPMNAAIQIGSLVGEDRITGLLVEENLMNGGNFTVNGGGGEVASAIYRNNSFGRDFRYGVAGNIGAGTWERSNVFQDDGTPAR